MRKSTATLSSLSVAAIALSLAACSTAPTTPPKDTGATKTVHLPRSFPVHDVPIIQGRLLVASGDAGDGWSITVVPRKGDLATAETSLKNAGFTITRSTKTTATLADREYIVSVRTPGHAITYLVTKE